MTTHLDLAEIIRSYFPPTYKATLLEVGAFHPTMISISYPLRSLGWTIISVEPNPEYIENFNEMNLPILPYAACAEDKGTTTFKISPNGASCSALEIKGGEYAKYMDSMGWTESNCRTIEVQALKLDTILQKHHPELKSIDVLTIDVEGWELEVLAGFNLEKFNPKVVCLENLNSSPDYISYMLSNGYRLNKKEMQDEFYVR
jgi:FkbM family methyltransferase